MANSFSGNDFKVIYYHSGNTAITGKISYKLVFIPTPLKACRIADGSMNMKMIYFIANKFFNNEEFKNKCSKL